MKIEGLVHLQGLGDFLGTEASLLVPGMVLSWNYSPMHSTVVSVKTVSASYVEVTTRNQAGEVFVKRMKKNRLVVASK